MAQKKLKPGAAQKLVSIIGDEDTVTGFLLTGIGERQTNGETNFLVVNSDTPQKTIEDTLKRLLKSDKISVILITQTVAEKVRHIINEWQEIEPIIMEIPSKEQVYDPKKDTIMQRAHRLLFGRDIDE